MPGCAICHAALPWIVDADPQQFDGAVDADMPVLVHFWAEWCGPCRMVSPIVERVGTEPAGRLEVVKLNVDCAPDVAARHRAMSIPTARPLPRRRRDRPARRRRPRTAAPPVARTAPDRPQRAVELVVRGDIPATEVEAARSFATEDHFRRPDMCITDFNRLRIIVVNPHHAGITEAERRLAAKVDAVVG